MVRVHANHSSPIALSLLLHDGLPGSPGTGDAGGDERRTIGGSGAGGSAGGVVRAAIAVANGAGAGSGSFAGRCFTAFASVIGFGL